MKPISTSSPPGARNSHACPPTLSEASTRTTRLTLLCLQTVYAAAKPAEPAPTMTIVEDFILEQQYFEAKTYFLTLGYIFLGDTAKS